MEKTITARVAIQCTCPDTGEVGSFLYTGESHRIPGTRITPVHDSLASLYPAIRDEGWKETGSRTYTKVVDPQPA